MILIFRDAKIAALEKTSQESEKLIAEARSERLKHMDELHDANKKCAELEGRIKDLESKLAEKNAMIKVLQQHSIDKDEAFQKSVFAQRNPGRHTRSASTMGLTNSNNNNHISGPITSLTNSDITIISTKETTSNEIPPNQSDLTGGSETNIKNLDEQLKELDSQLSNKV